MSGLVATWSLARGMDPVWTYTAVGCFGAFSLVAIAGGIARQIQRPHLMPDLPSATEPKPGSTVTLAGMMAAHIIGQEAASDAKQISTPSQDSPPEIRRELNSLPSWQREYLAKSYLGRKVQWEADIRASAGQGEQVRLFLNVSGETVWAIVAASPRVRLLTVNEKGVVTGTISAISGTDITLSPAEFAT